MSPENVEVVRTIYDAYERGDYPAAFECFHEDIEWFGPPDISNSGFARGHAGVRHSLSTWVGSWDEYHFELRELIDAGDQILAVGWHRRAGKGSGVEVSEGIFRSGPCTSARSSGSEMFRDRVRLLKPWVYRSSDVPTSAERRPLTGALCSRKTPPVGKGVGTPKLEHNPVCPLVHAGAAEITGSQACRRSLRQTAGYEFDGDRRGRDNRLGLLPLDVVGNRAAPLTSSPIAEPRRPEENLLDRHALAIDCGREGVGRLARP